MRSRRWMLNAVAAFPMLRLEGHSRIGNWKSRGRSPTA
jgi:hypothetical protein